MRSISVIAAILVSCLPLAAADSKEEIAKQKAAIKENLEKLKLKPAMVETNDLIVVALLPEEKAKALATAAQRTLAVARENLKYAKDESVFPGKLTLYVFADFGDLKAFVRQVEQRRPEADNHVQSLRGDVPYVALSPDAGSKLVDAELVAAASCWSAAAVLSKKLNTATGNLPDWLQIGYGRACCNRGESATKQAAQRQKVKAMLTAKGKLVWSKYLWTGEPLADRDLIAGSVVEYLAFSPHAEKFLAFARATKPAPDSDTPPSMDEALKTMELTADQLDQAWKTWVVKGK